MKFKIFIIILCLGLITPITLLSQQFQKIYISQVYTPSGSQIYGIKNGNWINLSQYFMNDTPTNSIIYGRINRSWTNITDMLFIDAPANSKKYARINNSWIDITDFLYSDAPSDTNVYSRINGSWTNITDMLFVDAPFDNSVYSRINGSWINIDEMLFDEAPVDSKLYARINQSWESIDDMFFVDAPSNYRTYARINNSWTDITEFLYSDAPYNGFPYVRINGTWDNLSSYLKEGDNLGNHVAESNLFMGPYDIVFTNDFSDTTNNVYELEHMTQTVNAIKISKWDDEAGIGGTNNAKYIYFEIPLNPGGYPGTWTDFEIKIEEITHTTDEYNMVYYWQSMGDPWDGNNLTFGDTNARCYFIDDHQRVSPLMLDPRKWQLYTNPTPGVVDSTALADRANHINSSWDTILFYPSHNGCYNDWTTWQWYTNSHNLRASWIRYSPINYEQNSLGQGRWHPIKINWINKRMNEEPLLQD